MHNMLKTKTFFAFCLMALPLVGAAQQRSVIGPVEMFQDASFRITVLGQAYSLTSATRFAIDGSPIALAEGVKALSGTQMVAIEGVDTKAGTLASRIDVLSVPYVPGANTVYLLGTIERKSSSRGEFQIGALRIDSSALDPELLSQLRVGSLVEVAGIQPMPAGRLVGPITVSIGRAGARVESIGGTGVRLESIGGTGAKLQSIGGTGAQMQSIGGTGSKADSIGGTGAKVQSIGGTGAKLQSIGGTGAQIQSIGGTGLKAESIGGTGTDLQSIGGTGAQAQSIGGTGVNVQSIGGTGVQAQSIGGTGAL
jgi:hypothetical protein